MQVSEFDGPPRCVLLHLSSAGVTVSGDSRGDKALPSRLCWMNRRGDVSAGPPPRCLRWTSCLQSCWRSSSHIYTAVSHVSRQRLWSPCEHLKAAGGGGCSWQVASKPSLCPARSLFRSTPSSFISSASIRLEHLLLFYRMITIDNKVWRLKLKNRRDRRAKL